MLRVALVGAKQVIVEGQPDSFWSPRYGQPPQPAAVRLGHRNCAGNNFTWPEGKPVWVRVTALLATGREVASATLFELEPPMGWGDAAKRARE